MTSQTLPIIVVRQVSKRFAENRPRISLRHEVTSLLDRWLHNKTATSSPADLFWALRDVSFHVHAGERIGIIGRNGAGKSTLLRILSGITYPTSGDVSVRGRFATLIALGAGFHPERTGRENIFLNAAIQGVSPREIKPLLNEIIRFSELEDFIDAPVKRYSTGMAARLGFSIAIHILPEIIFLDEILAVGDLAFQEKCMARMDALRHRDRTILFVSHDVQAVRHLCDRCIWLHQGQLIMDGPADSVLQTYTNVMKSGDLHERLQELRVDNGITVETA